MAMLANIRPLPGLYGGGFARVVQVETLPNGSPGGVVQAAVRLERLRDPLASFRQTLAQFESGQPHSQPQQPLDGNSLTLLQNIDSQQPLVPPFPPEQKITGGNAGEDSSSYAIELARLENLRQQARAEQARKEAARNEALRQFNEDNATPQPLGPDPLARLRQQIQTLSDDLNLASLQYDDLDGNAADLNILTATQAAKAYASAIAATA